MGQHDRPVSGTGKDTILDHAHSWSLPVTGINRPHDGWVTEPLHDQLALPLVDCAVGRAHGPRLHSGRIHDGAPRSGHLGQDLRITEGLQIAMGIGVVADFVTLRHNPPGEMRIDVHVLADYIKGRLDVAPPQDVEQARRVAGVRTVVKSHRNIGLVSQTAGVRDPD